MVIDRSVFFDRLPVSFLFTFEILPGFSSRREFPNDSSRNCYSFPKGFISYFHVPKVTIDLFLTS